MKGSTTNRQPSIKGENLLRAKQALASKSKSEDDFGLWLLIADILDMVHRGVDVYVTIGATREKTAYTATVRLNGQPSTLYADTFADLNHQASALVDDV